MNSRPKLSPAQRELLARLLPGTATAVRHCPITIEPRFTPEVRRPLYGWIGPGGDHYTLVFHPIPARGRSRVSARSGRIYAPFAGSDIPIVDFRTATGPRPLDGVREEFDEQNVYVKPPTLAEYCELARRAGAMVWELNHGNFRLFAETGFPPGMNRADVEATTEKVRFEIHAAPLTL